MSDPALTHEQIPHEPSLNSRLQSSSQMYRLTIRPKPGIDPVRALRAALKTLSRRYGLDVIEMTPYDGKTRQRTRAAVERRERYRTTPYYAFFGADPEGL